MNMHVWYHVHPLTFWALMHAQGAICALDRASLPTAPHASWGIHYANSMCTNT
jgi:hypothetical protein